MIAVFVVNNGDWCQESYETSSREAKLRAQQLRALGYTARCFPMGPQVTSYGTMQLTMVDVRPNEVHEDTLDIPPVETVREVANVY